MNNIMNMSSLPESPPADTSMTSVKSSISFISNAPSNQLAKRREAFPFKCFSTKHFRKSRMQHLKNLQKHNIFKVKPSVESYEQGGKLRENKNKWSNIFSDHSNKNSVISFEEVTKVSETNGPIQIWDYNYFPEFGELQDKFFILKWKELANKWGIKNRTPSFKQLSDHKQDKNACKQPSNNVFLQSREAKKSQFQTVEVIRCIKN